MGNHKVFGIAADWRLIFLVNFWPIYVNLAIFIMHSDDNLLTNVTLPTIHQK